MQTGTLRNKKTPFLSRNTCMGNKPAKVFAWCMETGKCSPKLWRAVTFVFTFNRVKIRVSISAIRTSNYTQIKGNPRQVWQGNYWPFAERREVVTVLNCRSSCPVLKATARRVRQPASCDYSRILRDSSAQYPTCTRAVGADYPPIKHLLSLPLSPRKPRVAIEGTTVCWLDLP